MAKPAAPVTPPRRPMPAGGGSSIRDKASGELRPVTTPPAPPAEPKGE